MPPEIDPNDKTKETPPPGISEEDVGRIVNAAVTSQLKRMLPSALTDAIGGLKLDELIATSVAKLAPVKADDDDPADKAKKSTKTDYERQLQDIAAKLEASEKKAADAERQRIETEQARRLDAGNTALRAALQQKLRPELLEVAASHWGTIQGRLKISEDGTPLLRVKRAPYKGAPEQDEDLPIAEAVQLLLASEEAKPFLPPPAAAQGKGSPGPRSNGSVTDGLSRYDAPANNDEERAHRAAEKEAQLKTRLGL